MQITHKWWGQCWRVASILAAGGWLCAATAIAANEPVQSNTPANTPAQAGTDGVQGVGKKSVFTKLAPAEQIEGQAKQQFAQLQKEAQSKNALAPPNHPQLVRLNAIAKKLIPYSYKWNDRAKQWQWEVSLIASPQVNAFCMPGGKIAFYTGILEKLNLTDDEVALVMGHEIAHALREHGRERMGKQMATQGLLGIGSALLGLGDTGRTVANAGASLLTLKFGREDETEADLVGLDLAARAGYDPRAGVILWQKMGAANKGAPPQWLSTHPSGNTRIADIQKHLKEVMPLYAKTKGVSVTKLKPYTSNWPQLKPVP